MAKSLRPIKIDEINLNYIEEHRKKLMQIGIKDPRLLTNNKILKFMGEKSKRNNKLIPLGEILDILGR